MRYATAIKSNGVMTATNIVPKDNEEEVVLRLEDSVVESSAYTEIGSRISPKESIVVDIMCFIIIW